MENELLKNIRDSNIKIKIYYLIAREQIGSQNQKQVEFSQHVNKKQMGFNICHKTQTMKKSQIKKYTPGRKWKIFLKLYIDYKFSP